MTYDSAIAQRPINVWMRNKVYFEALDLLSHNLNLQTTNLLILHVNEGDKWPAKSDFGLSYPSPAAPTVVENAGSKSSVRPITWEAFAPSKSVVI